SLLCERVKRVGRSFNCTIEKFVGGFEILIGPIIVGKIYENPGVLRTKRRRFFQIGSGLCPFALATLDCSNRHVDFRRVWQTSFCNRKLVQGFLIIPLAIIIVKSKREMCLG